MRGSPLRGAVSGLLFGVFLALFLLTIGVVPLDSILLLILPVLLLAGGIALGLSAPFKRSRLKAAPPSTP